ncbi:MAG: hypothetical protein AAF603_01030, partial [Pseudomonadota bacterium]
GYGYGWGPGFGPGFNDVTVRERNRYTALAYIVLGRGQKPANTPTAYSAQQVLENLGPVITRPEDS